MTHPIALYIHIPWCIRKCPYCDFNSHQLKTELPEQAYLQALKRDLQQDLLQFAAREVHSIFIGGGTPSLFSPAGIAQLIADVKAQISVLPDAEITLEANPGTVEQTRFAGFKAAGVNRLSIGVQSFQAHHLKRLGRIHDGDEAVKAILAAQAAGFTNINIDLMHGLAQQTVDEALLDLKTALSLQPTHLSWYQLTLEPHTAFFRQPPTLPTDEVMGEIQHQGHAYLAEQGFDPYEVSAYTTTVAPKPSQHNLNYWLFGDYLGIGAGAHGKFTDYKTHVITRTWKVKHPKEYLAALTTFIQGQQALSTADNIFEFMLNALRLYQPITEEVFYKQTGMDFAHIRPLLLQAQKQNFLNWDKDCIETTALGKRYLNDLLMLFL